MSVAIDPHKMGMSTIPSGGLLYRDESHMKSLEISARYLTSQVQSSLAGTRTGASAAATYAVMRHLGMDGYRQMSRHVWIIDATPGQPRRHGPRAGPRAGHEHRDGEAARRAVDPQEALRHGWYVSTTSRPEALRMVVMPHVTRHVIESFICDLKKYA